MVVVDGEPGVVDGAGAGCKRVVATTKSSSRTQMKLPRYPARPYKVGFFVHPPYKKSPVGTLYLDWNIFPRNCIQNDVGEYMNGSW